MINWDFAMKQAHAETQLQVLSLAARVSFATGSLYHAYLYIRTTQSWSKTDLLFFPILDQAFLFAWDNLTIFSRLPSQIERLTVDLEKLAPNEGDFRIPGQADLIDGVLQLLSLNTDSKAKQVMGIASYAYQAITDIAIPDVSGDEEDFLKAERSSEICLQEIEFQLTYLKTLNILNHNDVRWDNVIANLQN